MESGLNKNSTHEDKHWHSVDKRFEGSFYLRALYFRNK